MITLDVALDRLIHRRSYRAAFLAGDGVPGLSEAHLKDLGSLDARTLNELGTRVATDLFSRSHAGSGSLLDLYPRTIDAFRTRQAPSDADAVHELAFAFMESPAFDGYREVPHAGPGLSLEEAFFRYAEVEAIGDGVVREMEFLAAMAKLLCASPQADIALPVEMRRTGGGYYAVGTRGSPTLYGALRGRYVKGPLTPFLVDLLAAGADFTKTAERHGVSNVVLTESLRRLSDLGIF